MSQECGRNVSRSTSGQWYLMILPRRPSRIMAEQEKNISCNVERRRGAIDRGTQRNRAARARWMLKIS